MNIPDPDLTAEILVPAYEACQRLLNLLENNSLRQVALWKLAGHTNEEIRLKLGCSVVTVELCAGWHPRNLETEVGPGPANRTGEVRSPP